MSDPNITIQRQIQTLQDGHERLRKADVPAFYLPWTQRVLNPFPLASSAVSWGDAGLPWASYILAFYVSVYVNTTNNGTNFWTIALTNHTGVPYTSVTTAAISANTWTRLSVTTGITQPGATDPAMEIIPTATLSPGAIYIVPSVALLRIGN